jgi:hypothetical protein
VLRLPFRAAKPRQLKATLASLGTLPSPPLPELDEPGTVFRFLDATERFPGPVDWGVSRHGRLWSYHLHYFEYLRHLVANESARARGFDLLEEWIATQPRGSEPGWEPYPLSLRIVEWIRFLVAAPDGSRERVEHVLPSIVEQVRTLRGSLERDLLANHYLKNLKALYVAGCALLGKDAERWRAFAASELEEQLDEQVLSDGGHYERSPMYHTIALEDVLDLIAFARARGERCAGYETRAARLRRFLASVLHEDGEIPFFNDSALGQSAPARAVLDYADTVLGPDPVPRGDAAFPETGLFVARSVPRSTLVLDCGPIGPAYQPGHAHNDALSFELSVGGKRIIVNSGTSTYESGEVREFERSTAAHNTLRVNGLEQNETWSSHRVGRRIAVTHFAVDRAPGGALFRGGYRLGTDPRIEHERHLECSSTGYRIRDVVRGPGELEVESFLRAHPDVSITFEDGRATFQHRDGPRVVITSSGQNSHAILDSHHAPRFGRRLAAKVLVLRARGRGTIALEYTVAVRP